jgi:hypothetical protein
VRARRLDLGTQHAHCNFRASLSLRAGSRVCLSVFLSAQGARKIEFPEFQKALALLAEERGIGLEKAKAAVVAAAWQQGDSCR